MLQGSFNSSHASRCKYSLCKCLCICDIFWAITNGAGFNEFSTSHVYVYNVSRCRLLCSILHIHNLVMTPCRLLKWRLSLMWKWATPACTGVITCPPATPKLRPPMDHPYPCDSCFRNGTLLILSFKLTKTEGGFTRKITLGLNNCYCNFNTPLVTLQEHFYTAARGCMVFKTV